MSKKFNDWVNNVFLANYDEYAVEFGKPYQTNGNVAEWRSITIIKPKVSNFIYACKILYKDKEWAVVDMEGDGQSVDMLNYSQIEDFICAIEDKTGNLFDEYRC